MPELLSVNVSLPRTAVIAGKPDTTGLYKKPVQGRVEIRRDGLAGDGVHRHRAMGWLDQAVYALDEKHSLYWAETLGMDPFPHGHLGENLSVRGLDETEVRVGDLFRIGGVLLRATAPRAPCYKLADRLNQGPEFPDRFLRTGRTGIYFRVLEEGDVGAGDAIDLVERDDTAVTIAEFTRVAFFDTDDRDGLKRILDSRHLGDLWRAHMDKLAGKTQSESWAGHRRFVVARKVPESETVASFYLQPEDARPLPRFKPGQFLPIELDVPGRDGPVIRTYTLSDSPNHPDRYRLSVKREPARGPEFAPGLASNFLHDSVSEGSIIRAKMPNGDFYLDEDSERPVALLSGGVGLTPMISMLNALVEQGNRRPAWFIHGVRNGAEHAFGAHVRGLAADHDQVTAHVLYMEPGADDVLGRDYDTAGVLTPELLKDLLPSPDMDFYLCGPPPFMKAVYGYLTDWGVDEARIHYEFFGPATVLKGDAAPKPTRAAVAANVTVTFAKSGKTVPWDPEMESILELAESVGLFPDFSCRSGICQTCMCELADGEVTYAEEPTSPPDEGWVLICSAVPKTDVTVDV